ncbi:hypothetical protein [Vannielia sp. SX4]|uniref:hypothetical protein n=1 Tax=Vannielia sp. SX4 TaxID=3463852 RepID=UPI0040580E77
MARPALAALLLLSLAACRDDPQVALLTGDWLCTSQPGDYTMERQVSYGEGGTLSGRTDVQSTDGGTPVAMQFSFSGTWELSEGALTEHYETHRLMRFAEAGQNVPLAELPSGMITEDETALANQLARYRIEEISANALRLRDTDQGIETTCTPA